MIRNFLDWYTIAKMPVNALNWNHDVIALNTFLRKTSKTHSNNRASKTSPKQITNFILDRENCKTRFNDFSSWKKNWVLYYLLYPQKVKLIANNREGTLYEQHYYSGFYTIEDLSLGLKFPIFRQHI